MELRAYPLTCGPSQVLELVGPVSPPPGSLHHWGGVSFPPNASEGSLYALSRASGRRNGSPTVFRHPPLGRLQTRRNCWCPAGVLLSFATVTAPRGNLRKRSTCFVTASNVTACRAAAGKLARIDCVLTAFEPAALREQIAHVTPHHARPAPLCDVLEPSTRLCCLAPVARVLEPCGEPFCTLRALFYGCA